MLVILLFVPIAYDSFIEFYQYIQILILFYIGVVLLKSKVNKAETLVIMILLYANERIDEYIENKALLLIFIIILLLTSISLI